MKFNTKTRALHAANSLKILSPKRHIILAKNEFRVIPLVCTYSPFGSEHYFEFQEYTFSNGRDMTKKKFLHNDKAIAIPWVFP